MEGAGEQRFDLSAAKATAVEAARQWRLELGEPFAFSYVSYVAPAGGTMVKVAWGGDDESPVAIDPKPYLADREYDLPAFLWNPLGNGMEDREQTERRIAAFVSAGLDDFRIRAWTVIRGAYLRAGYAHQIRALL